MLAGERTVRSTGMLVIMLGAMFLTFSRGAWAQFVAAAAITMVLTFVTTRSVRERIRIGLLAIGAVVGIAMLLMVLLSIEKVSEVFSERAALEQAYDIGRYGRFGRYMLGLDLALEHPLGIGPLQFYRLFVEDPHNTFLNAFMSGGWLAGLGYATLCAVTLTMSSRFLFARTPWQSSYQVFYAAYVGVICESVIVDIDHWRHYFLILGVLWGLMAASRRFIAVSAAGYGPGSAGVRMPVMPLPALHGTRRRRTSLVIGGA